VASPPVPEEQHSSTKPEADRGGVLSKAAAMLRVNFGSLDDLPDEVANTIANHCYDWILLTSEPTLPRIVVGRRETTEGRRREIAWRLAHFVDELADLRDLRRSEGERAFAQACELFVDVHKYRIVAAHHKSALRRKIERMLKGSGEIPDLYGLMRDSADQRG
jgi:hypothetical protein